jgi:hypothetical protein
MRTSKIAAIVAAIVASSLSLFGQAAVEGALTHALSSAVGSTAGSAMGRAANQLAGRVGQRVASEASTPPVSARKNVPRKTAPAQAPSSPFGKSLIASIQGGEAPDTSCASTTKTPGEKPEKPNVKVQNRCPVTTSKATDDHPSVINLSATN